MQKKKSIKWREKGAKQGCRLEEQIIGWGGTKRENHHETGKHFHGWHKAIKALLVFLIKII